MARRVLTIAACVVALALPPLNAVAAARAKSVTKTVLGSNVTCKKWGQLQLHLKITQSVVGGKVKAFKILAVTWPVWPQHTVRSVFIIGPDKKVKLMITYPASTGRNFDEVLRVVDALQLTAKHGVSTPVNWKPGSDVVIPAAMPEEQVKRLFPDGYKTLKPYLRLGKQPK